MLAEDDNTSKKHQIYQWLKDAFNAGSIEPGDRIPSENELCARFGASRPSVRQATARLAHEGLVRIERGRGTFRLAPPAAGSRDVGILLPSLTTYFYPEIISSAGGVLSAAGYQTLFDCSEGDDALEIAALERYAERRPAGLIISPLQHEAIVREGRTFELLKDLQAAGCTIVLLDNTFARGDFHSIVIDDYGAGRRAEEYLSGQGYRAPAVAWATNHRPFYERRRGFADASIARGTALTEERELRLESEGGADCAECCGAFIEALVEGQSEGAAVFCCSDKLAYLLKKEARKRAIPVPERLSLVGFDDSPIARLAEVSLTSFAYPARFVGQKAARIITETIEGNAGFARTSISIEPVLVERGSVHARSIT